jgi:hypothetical protein
MTLVGQLLEIKDSINKDLRLNGSDARPVPVYLSREFSWAYPGKPTESQGELRNYAPGELRIHAIGASVEIGTSSTAVTKALVRTSNGYYDSTGGVSITAFDFEWNLSYSSSGSQYGVMGHTDRSPYVSSECFRGQDAGARFDITPLRLGLNESILLTVRPTSWYTASSSLTFFVRMHFWGTRSYA